MVALCRHIKTNNTRCGSPAIHAQLYCYHHRSVKKATRRPPRRPNDFTYIIPFVFAEDRTAVQINLHLVNQALMEGRIDTRTANAYTQNIRIALSNLRLGPLSEHDHENPIQRVILTPEGEEIAPPLEMLEENENPPQHNPDCPCQRCAEQYRNAQPEQHHTQCQCGFCQEPSVQPSAISHQQDPQRSTNECHSERSAEREVEEPAVPQPSHENKRSPSNPSVLSVPSVVNQNAPSAAPRPASATQLYDREPLPHASDQDDDLYDYESVLREYWARQEAKQAGLEVPPTTYDLSNYESEGMKRYKATMEQVEKNKQIANEIWERRFGSGQQHSDSTSQQHSESPSS